MDVVARARALLAEVAHLLDEPGEEAVVTASRFDGVLFDEAVAASPRLVEAMWSLQRHTPYANDLYRDLYAFFYQQAPLLREREAIKRSRWANERVLRTVAQLPETQQLRLLTRHDALSSAAVVADLAPSVQCWMQQVDPDPLGEVLRLAFALESALDAGAPGEQVARLGEQLQQAASEAEARDGQAQQVGPASGQGLRRALTQDMDQARQDAQSLAVGRSAFGLEPGRLAHLPMAQQVRLGETLNSHALRQWLALLGRLLAATASPQVSAGRARLSGVRLSDELGEMVAGEVAMSTHPVLRLEQLARLADGELLTNDYTGPNARGPVVLLCDESGSMNESGGVAAGHSVPRWVWAKAFCLAVAARMRTEHRPLRIVSFSSASQQRTWNDSPQDLLGFGEHMFNGMTAFEPAMDVAIAEAVALGADSSRGLVTASIVLVTDDDRANPAAQWLTQWGHTSADWNVLGVSVGVDSGTALRAICDEVVSVRDFVDARNFSSLVARIS